MKKSIIYDYITVIFGIFGLGIIIVLFVIPLAIIVINIYGYFSFIGLNLISFLIAGITIKLVHILGNKLIKTKEIAITIDTYKVDFKLILSGCEPFSQIYSEIKKFAEVMKEKI